MAPQISPVLADAPVFRDAIVKRSIREPIADKIEALIASGLLQVGDALPSERDLAGAFSVSRETVRGAVQRLASRGILEISQGTRTRVARTDVGPVTVGFATARRADAYDLESVHAARLLVESQVVADAARHMDRDTLASLDSAVAAQAAAAEDPVRFLISDREFHTTIYRAGPNALLADFALDLYTYMMAYRRTAISRPGAIAQSTEDHRGIVDALRRGDAEAAVRAFGLHTERIYVTTRSLLAATS